MKSLVSIIIPTYNRSHTLGATLDSVLSQSLENWECIVIDDDSSDQTDELLEFYQERDSRIRYYKRPAHLLKGANACRNYGFKISSGKYIQWLDSDDILFRDKLRTQVGDLEKLEENGLATCKFGYHITEDGKKFIRKNVSTYRHFSDGTELLKTFGIHREFFPPHVFLTPRRLIDKAGLWNEQLEINQDAEFYTRILLLRKPVHFSDTCVYYTISKEDNVSLISSERKARKIIESWEIIQSHLTRSGYESDHPYVLQAKAILFDKLQYDYPEVIKDNLQFFKAVLPFYKRLILKIF